ncbi:hypothetical protein PR003_g34281 [Phytophthora rubi]|uniref:Crinkler effector protein N-terminal domain-containing protein n=1 Tax=Phytophthora rubi TaxID=129364 RepID=A0A6A4ATV5_9STRA|nr:hypothetical protein PR003_g34281 [Phytophthora rubi]
MVKLFCAIVGVAGSAYGVEVARGGAVDDLEDAIRKKSSDRIECDDQLQLFLAMTEGPEWLSSMDPDVISMRSGCVPERVKYIFICERRNRPHCHDW